MAGIAETLGAVAVPWLLGKAFSWLGKRKRRKLAKAERFFRNALASGVDAAWPAVVKPVKKKGQKLPDDIKQRAREYAEAYARRMAAEARVRVNETPGGKTVALLIKEIVDARKRR